MVVGMAVSACGGTDASQSKSDARVKNAALSAVACKDGGKCKLGDTGPGGGFVFIITPYMYNKVDGVSGGGIYTEFLRLDKDPAYKNAQFGCAGVALEKNSYVFGAGAQNTKNIVEACPGKKTLAERAMNATINGQSDWYLPSQWELHEVCQYARGRDGLLKRTFGCSVEYYVVNEIANINVSFLASDARPVPELDPGNNRAMTVNLTKSSNDVTDRTNGTASAGFMRSFGAGPAAPTTTLPPACKDGGTCKIGDTGPAGGTVFYVGKSAVNNYGDASGGGKYMEFLDPNTKAKYGCTKNSKTDAGDGIGVGARNTWEYMKNCSYTSSAAQWALDATNGGKSDWFVPSLRELLQICRFIHNQETGDYKDCDTSKAARDGSWPTSVYWSATQYSANSMWAVRFDNAEQVKRDKGDYNYNFLLVRAFG